MKQVAGFQMRTDDEMTARIQDAIGEILWINRQIVKQNEMILTEFLSPLYVIDESAIRGDQNNG